LRKNTVGYDRLINELMLIFSQFFESGKVPDIWKTAMTPLYKKGLASDVNICRPISLTRFMTDS